MISRVDADRLKQFVRRCQRHPASDVEYQWAGRCQRLLDEMEQLQQRVNRLLNETRHGSPGDTMIG